MICYTFFEIFWDFLNFYHFGFFFIFGFFKLIFVFFVFFFLEFLDFLDFFGFFFKVFDFILIFYCYFGIPFKVTKVTTKSYQGYYWTPKMGQNSIIRSIFAQKKSSAEGRSPLHVLEVGPCSGPYLLVLLKIGHLVIFLNFSNMDL